MKCVLTVTDRDSSYLRMAKVLVITARTNSDTDLTCIYDGQNESFVSWLSKWDVPVIKWHVPFKDKIRKLYNGKKTLDYCCGAYLCIEIPRALKAHGIYDKYALYLDADTMILNNLQINNELPVLLSAPPDWDINDWSFVSAGVMVLNLNGVYGDYDRFVAHLEAHNFNFEFAGHGPCSQGAWNTFYEGKWSKLNPEYDWKPWWGFNPEARIIHFSGPKPNEIPALLKPKGSKSETERQKINRFVVEQDPESYRRYLQIWRNYEKLIED